MPAHDSHALLDRAVDAFDDILSDRGWGQPPALLRTRGGLDPDAGAELAVRPLDGHPAEALLGFSAPLGWTAIGVSAEGWARHYDGFPTGYTATSPTGEVKRRVRTITLLDRDGTLAGRLRGQDGELHREAPSEGLVVDCLRRALGLATSPPTAPTNLLFATLWLEAIGGTGRRGCRSLTWREAARLHPAVRMLEEGGQGHRPESLVEIASALGRVCDWTLVRDQAIRGWNVGADAQTAVWMDSGMLSRWLLDQHLPVDELTARVRRRCTPAAMRKITEALAALGVTAAGEEPGRDHHPGAA